MPLKKVFESENNSTRNFLKLDVQGSELDCLESAGNMLQNFMFIQCEASIAALYENEKTYLELIGYLSEKSFDPIFFFPGTGNQEQSLAQLEIFFKKN